MRITLNNFSVYDLWNLYQEDKLTINPNYQRRDVWLQKDKIRLIETLLIGNPIPEIYLWETKKDGIIKYEIIDGQQRLRAIFDYISDSTFRLNPKWLEFTDCSYANSTFEELADTDKLTIWQYQLVVRLISDVDIESIKRIFLRMNSTSYSLNPQELRKADFNGLFLKLSEDLANLDFWSKYDVFSKNDVRRMRDVEFCSSILIFLRLGFQSETQSLINNVYDTFNDSYDELEDDYLMFNKMLAVVDQFLSINSMFARSKVHLFTLFTLAYWFITNGRDISKTEIYNFNTFCEYYKISDDELENSRISEEYIQAILDYKGASLEGTNTKIKRYRRFETLRMILCGEITA
ncbi:GmrSD restriction endonuclease domain-containing protein [Brevibacillus brevis]|uniref:GmrSD restriction endonuclease domain-containing protein n=1 Tax=Brevibacillus brevis TaxID=1393 RepID=UPI001EDB57B5|nr:DUF262 domain-containing protein [Brevibacillus brevis]